MSLQQVKELFDSTLTKLSDIRSQFVQNPKKDFTRNRKLPFQDVIKLLLSIGGQSLPKEMLDAYHFDVEAPSASAFIQQRKKIKAEAFLFFLRYFASQFLRTKQSSKYRYFAADGSYLNIHRNPEDEETHIKSVRQKRGFNQLHLNALYDLEHKIYVDAMVQTRKKKDEKEALLGFFPQMKAAAESPIIILDRGYESINMIGHLINEKMNFVLRVRAPQHKSSVLFGMDLPINKAFDKQLEMQLTRSAEAKRENPQLKWVRASTRFDFLEKKSVEIYTLPLRIIAIEVGEGNFIHLVTNLENKEFPTKEFQGIYHMRWGIEVSFSELKYDLGLAHFHSKNPDFVLQEIFAKLLMYNYCSMILNSGCVEKKVGKHVYQRNFTVGTKICIRFFRGLLSVQDTLLLLQKNLLPIRPDRSFGRRKSIKRFIPFNYRVT